MPLPEPLRVDNVKEQITEEEIVSTKMFNLTSKIKQMWFRIMKDLFLLAHWAGRNLRWLNSNISQGGGNKLIQSWQTGGGGSSTFTDMERSAKT